VAAAETPVEMVAVGTPAAMVVEAETPAAMETETATATVVAERRSAGASP
jgi:hypothetical protein